MWHWRVFVYTQNTAEWEKLQTSKRPPAVITFLLAG
jgi:hypothetical protein